MAQVRYATAEDDAEDVPPDERCIWPGCTRRRAPGRPGGSGRQKEYCEKADRPPAGGTGQAGGPEHNARNRWATRERAPRGGTAATHGGDGQPAPGEGAPGSASWTHAKLHATELLQRARQQHAAALEALAAERDQYAQLAAQLQVLADPAALDLEIATVTLKAGREVAQAAEDAARARQAQLTAQRERDEAIAAERDAGELLASRTADLEAERDRLITEALDAGQRAEAAREEAADARQEAARARRDAEQATSQAEAAERQARQQAAAARQDADRARDTAARQVAEATARADAAAIRAEDAVRRAEERASAERARADAEAERAAAQLATARAEAAAARDEATVTRAERDAARAEAAAARSELAALRAEATAAAEHAAQQAGALRADIGRLREEADRARAERDRDLARLEAAHRDAMEAERARALRAEGELDSLRAAQQKGLDG